jgi:hypothetical protein
MNKFTIIVVTVLVVLGLYIAWTRHFATEISENKNKLVSCMQECPIVCKAADSTPATASCLWQCLNQCEEVDTTTKKSSDG